MPTLLKEARFMEQRVTRKDLPLVLSFMLPGVILMAVLIILPVILIVQYSLFEASGFTGAAEYVGMQNYVNVMNDDRFWGGLIRTVVYAFGTVALQLVVGIAIAVLLNESFPGNQFVRGAAVVPYIIPVIVVTIGWEWILDPDVGLVNTVLGWLGLSDVQFLSVDLAMATSIGLSVWAWTPFVVLVFLAGLQTVPAELHESAQMDGAGVFRRFFTITLPMLSGLILTIVLLRGIWMFNKFDLIYLLTGGGPLERTETLPVYTYVSIFKMFNVGHGSAIAVISFVIMLVTMLVYLKIFDRDEPRSRRRLSRLFTRKGA